MSCHIGIVGSGNLASHLSQGLADAGLKLSFIHSRNSRKGKSLARRAGTGFLKDVPQAAGTDSLLFICTSDQSIESLFKTYTGKGYTLIHCSGMVSMPDLRNHGQPTGVFYPVQSFSELLPVVWKDLPVCLEGSDAGVLRSLKSIAHQLGCKQKVLNSRQRAYLHLAAVFANNFSNAHYMMAESILKEMNLPFNLLRPLILQTALKIQQASPREVQTGPARRHDMKSIRSHLELLSHHPEKKKIYKALTAYLLHPDND
ncbi:MAG: DUF2520 domain-containing protein [Bacteroidia bacterium]|nr:DUF2520 domain-containing protein [Bacteroidia bacterium]